MAQMIETATSEGAHKSYLVVDENGAALGSLDWLPSGEFVSYVGRRKRKHPNCTAALRRVVDEATS